MIQAHDTISVTVPDAVGARVKSLAILSTLAFAGDGWQQQYRLPLRQGYITADYASRDITATLDITALKTGIDIRRGMP
jgi:hypothetical protein